MDSFDWDRFFDSVDLEDLATAPDFVIDEGTIPVISEQDLTAQGDSLYHCISNEGPVVFITDYGTIRIVPEPGKTAGEALTRATIDFADELVKMHKFRQRKSKYSDPIVVEYYKLWEKYYRYSEMSAGKLADRMLEELPTTMKQATLKKWIIDWRLGRRLPR